MIHAAAHGPRCKRACIVSAMLQCCARINLVMALFVALCACGAPTEPEQSVRFFESDGARLAYSLDLPPGAGPFPAAVIGHGSGRVTRDQLKWFSDRLLAAGFATLRFDKRGVGESTGQYSEVDRRTPVRH
jgi:hypothetical protein